METNSHTHSVHLSDQIPASLLPLHNSLPYCIEGNDSATCAEAMLKSLKVEGLGNSWFDTTRQLKSLVTQQEGWRPEPAVDFFFKARCCAQYYRTIV